MDVRRASPGFRPDPPHRGVDEGAGRFQARESKLKNAAAGAVTVSNLMTQVAQLLAANKGYAAARANVTDARPGRHIAVVTCMDARIDVFAVLGLHLGEAHIIRNAGGRVTDDVLRSLALSSHVLGVDTVVVMQHTECGLAGVTDEELRQRTGADLEFFPIDDHVAALREDIETLSVTSFLAPLRAIAGFIYDVQTGELEDVAYWERPAASGDPSL
jgi:carbonic anhydrase